MKERKIKHTLSFVMSRGSLFTNSPYNTTRKSKNTTSGSKTPLKSKDRDNKPFKNLVTPNTTPLKDITNPIYTPIAMEKAQSKKSNKSSSKENDNDPPVKIPKQFIVRPTNNFTPKNQFKIYLHPSVLKNLDISNGSHIHVSRPGEMGIVGEAIAAEHKNLVEINTIQISKSLRRLGALVLGDRIEIKKYELIEYADTVEVSISNDKNHNEINKETSLLLEKNLYKVKRLFTEIGIVMPGIIISPIKVGSETEPLSVVITDSYGIPTLEKLSLNDNEEDHDYNSKNPSVPTVSPVFLFNQQTEIKYSINNVPKQYNLPMNITYNSVGGLSEQIKLLSTNIKLPLKSPQYFTHFSISPPRGVLLHGPPGTGKTMLLRAVANETDAHVLTINGPSIVSKYLGETESALRAVFEEARKYQPSIIFMDEIDSLAPKRDSDDSGEAESRVVSTLLTLMDGMSNSGRVVVVAATNRPNSIDPALRRHGRFDEEIEVGVPDINARLDILRLQYQKMGTKHSLSKNDIETIAAKTHGYVGADIVALVRESAKEAIKRGDNLKIPLSNLKITIDDMNKAMLKIRPSAMREIFLETPKVYWKDIGGQEEIKRKLNEMITLPLKEAEIFKNKGLKAPKGLLMYGPPGCSKTLVAKALATETGVNFLAVKGPEIFNKFVGESEKKIREIFHKAKAASPSIIFFDEIDAIGSVRSSDGSSHSSDNVLTTLLNEIDGVEELKGVVIVAATNRPHILDPALLRPGRLDRHIYVRPPNVAARKQILINSIKDMTTNLTDEELQKLAEMTEGCSGADMTLVSQEAGLSAFREDIHFENVEFRHFLGVLENIPRMITKESLEVYEDFSSHRHIHIE